MIGFLALMLLLAGLVCLGSYWISWESQDVKSRPRFAAKIGSDLARFLRDKSQSASPSRANSGAMRSKQTGAPESSA